MKHLFAAAALACSAACATVLADIPKGIDAVSPAPGVIVSGRIDAGDILELREAGVRHVIDLTLDAETPDFDESAAVRETGMSYSNLPIRGASDLTEDNVRAFDELLRKSGRPVLVHCSSGNRVGAMAALRAAWIERKSPGEVIALGKAWGLKGLEEEVRKRIEATAGSVKIE